MLWPFVLVVVAQAALAGFSVYAMSAVRAYVGGESYWSKSQKDAVRHLDLFADTGSPHALASFREAIAIPLADRAARLALEETPPDHAAAREGFIAGRNHPSDVGSLIWFYENFKHISYFKRSIDKWIEGDRNIDELQQLADEIVRENATGAAVDRRDWHLRLHDIDDRIAKFSEAFAASLGEGSRFIRDLLLIVNLLAATTLIVLGVWGTGNLMRQRTKALQALQEERRRAEVTLASIEQAVFTTDAQGNLDYLNPAAQRLSGIEGLIGYGRPLHSMISLTDAQTGEDRSGLLRHLSTGDDRDIAGVPHNMIRRRGEPVTVSLTAAPLSGEGSASGAVIVLHDMTRERDFIRQLSWQASHDALTGLVNRREFESRLAALVDGVLPEEGAGLIYLDLDQFKLVNDTCGHAAGDALLRQISLLLEDQSNPADIVARLGGDEFGLLLPGSDLASAQTMAESLRAEIEGTGFVWNKRGFRITASIGLVHIEGPGHTLEETLRTADVACYLAKEKGRNRVQLHCPSDTELRRKFGEMVWVQRIRDALDEQRFFLEAQSIKPLHKESEAKHIEVLLRLRDENGRIVPPSTFIPAAERYGLMPLLDRWVVRRTFAELAARQSRQEEEIGLCAINLSGDTMSDRTFSAFVENQFRQSNIDPSTICFEITETAVIANLNEAISFIETMRRMGCRFALDDFGAGMSSFTYLKRLPVDYLKIDGSFVRDVLRDPIDRAMVETINRIGKLMGKQTIAEFVESPEIATVIRRMGVDYAQGYGIAMPEAFSGDAGATPSQALDAVA
jgi:diguanylate cyclase (GGDEF)-like protein/PAS domain S-box-containing protein